MRPIEVFSLTTLIAFTLGAHPPGAADDPPADPAGDAAACADPCAGASLFGPETFTRVAGKPITHARSFELADDGDVCVLVGNAGASAARIDIDGVTRLSPIDFDPAIGELTATVSLAAGTHTLSVWLAGRPNSAITVAVRACADEPPRLCSEVAREYCESKGWVVVSEPDPPIGNIVCTVDGRGPENNCGTCAEYNIVAWSDASPEQYCAGSYSTQAGNVYGGHVPCTCADNLYYCDAWDPQGCVPD